jgi:4-amino-4-deoxychorismate lyase
MSALVFLDPELPAGRVADPNRPALLASDQGATRGDGIFESMLAVDGTPRKLQAHLDRLAASAVQLDLEIPPTETWQRAIQTALAEYGRQSDAGAGVATDPPTAGGQAAGSAQSAAREAVVKLFATRGVEGRGPTAWVQVVPVPTAGKRQRETGLDVLLLDRGYDSRIADRAPWLLLGAKTLSYAVNMAALRYAHQHGADDVIFTSSDGQVLEGPTSSVLLAHVEDGDTPVRRLITPQLDSGILPGTTQGALFAAAREAGWELGYGPLVPEDLFDADAVWLISSIRLLAPVNTSRACRPDCRAQRAGGCLRVAFPRVAGCPPIRFPGSLSWSPGVTELPGPGEAPTGCATLQESNECQRKALTCWPATLCSGGVPQVSTRQPGTTAACKRDLPARAPSPARALQPPAIRRINRTCLQLMPPWPTACLPDPMTAPFVNASARPSPTVMCCTAPPP